MGNLCNITRIHTVPYQTGSPHAESCMRQAECDSGLVVASAALLPSSLLVISSVPLSTLSLSPSCLSKFQFFGPGYAESRPDILPEFLQSPFSIRWKEPPSSTEYQYPASCSPRPVVPVARCHAPMNEFSDFSRLPSPRNVWPHEKKKRKRQ